MFDPRERDFRGHLAMLVTNLIFGLNTPIAKTILGHESLTPFSLTLFRMIGAAALFWMASLFTRREKVTRRDLVLLFFASLLGIQLNQVCFLIGLSMTSPIDASVIATMVPILTMVLAALYLKEPVTWKKVIGVLVGASGALLLIMNSRHHTNAGSSAAGNMICLVGALAFASYLTFFKNLISRYRPVTLMKWMFLFAAVCCMPLGFRDLSIIDYHTLSSDIILRILYVVIAATFISYMLIPVGQKFLRPTVVSMYNYVQPVVTSLVAVAIGLDVFGWVKTGAAALVFLGVYIVTASKSRAQVEAEKRWAEESARRDSETAGQRE